MDWVERAAHDAEFAQDLCHTTRHPLRQYDLGIFQGWPIQEEHPPDALHYIAIEGLADLISQVILVLKAVLENTDLDQLPRLQYRSS